MLIYTTNNIYIHRPEDEYKSTNTDAEWPLLLFLDFMWAGFGGPRASLANVAAVAAVLCDPERADQAKKTPAKFTGVN